MLRHSEDGGEVLGAVAAVAVVPGALDDSIALAEDDSSSLDSTGTSVTVPWPTVFQDHPFLKKIVLKTTLLEYVEDSSCRKGKSQF